MILLGNGSIFWDKARKKPGCIVILLGKARISWAVSAISGKGFVSLPN